MSNIETEILENYQEFSDIETTFGTTKLLPHISDVPDEYSSHAETKWNKLFNDLYFSDVRNLEVEAKEGIDAEAAWTCVRAHMASWDPKHEHKEAGVAYMMSILFKDATWSTA